MSCRLVGVCGGEERGRRVSAHALTAAQASRFATSRPSGHQAAGTAAGHSSAHPARAQRLHQAAQHAHALRVVHLRIHGFYRQGSGGLRVGWGLSGARPWQRRESGTQAGMQGRTARQWPTHGNGLRSEPHPSPTQTLKMRSSCTRPPSLTAGPPTMWRRCTCGGRMVGRCCKRQGRGQWCQRGAAARSGPLAPAPLPPLALRSHSVRCTIRTLPPPTHAQGGSARLRQVHIADVLRAPPLLRVHALQHGLHRLAARGHAQPQQHARHAVPPLHVCRAELRARHAWCGVCQQRGCSGGGELAGRLWQPRQYRSQLCICTFISVTSNGVPSGDAAISSSCTTAPRRSGMDTASIVSTLPMSTSSGAG